MTELTELILHQHGFQSVKDDAFVNGREWLLPVAGEPPSVEDYEIICRRGTWFSACGDCDFNKNGFMWVSTLCRGNYVCNNVGSLEELKLLYLALNGKELEKVL